MKKLTQLYSSRAFEVFLEEILHESGPVGGDLQLFSSGVPWVLGGLSDTAGYNVFPAR